MRIEDMREKNILILGFGREGKDTLSFLRKHFPKQKIGIADKQSLTSFKNPLVSASQRNIKLHLGKFYLKSLKKYDVIVKSPGIPPRLLGSHLTSRQKVTSQTAIFFANCPGTIIGITGTKGKSTTASLAHHILKKGGIKAHLVGNIGKPALRFLSIAKKNDVFVYELSSFQLGELRQSPHIAVLLNIYPEHLDYYRNSKEYVDAKAIIAKYQTSKDILIYNKKDPLVSRIVKTSKAKKIPFTNLTRLSYPHLNRVKFDKFKWVASTEPAKIVGKLFKIPQAKIEKAISEFKPLPHRLQRVGEWKGITFINDSLATIPEATIAALDALGPQVHTLIAGGMDRGISYKKLSKRIGGSDVKTLILFPNSGKKIAQGLPKNIQVFRVKTMKEAVRIAYQYSPQKTLCLLSPASPSFNLFRDYKDRGEQFMRWVKTYAKKKP